MLVIDEAHLLDNHQLEAIRLLTNHDMDSGSPFAVILVGQPSLRHRLRLGGWQRWISASRSATPSPE
ncbi:AAA domain protein [Mycobacterium xenopi 4042]|uniref:AAA domain protein n=1 Tax=Mycobacterium xenopi 4042 TaxID=1299334 RepID=X8A8I7_MYCXE|nr:AAA domain protein [Mycobacterium xenopi 4042]